MRNWFEHKDIDYADVLMLCAAAMAGTPAAVLVCYGTFSAVANGARLMASILV